MDMISQTVSDQIETPLSEFGSNNTRDIFFLMAVFGRQMIVGFTSSHS